MPYCPYPKHAITIRSDGTVDPCCAWRDNHSQNQRIMFYDTDKWKDKFNKLSDRLENGWPAGCKECEVSEKQGKESMRTRGINKRDFLDTDGIVDWDFKLNVTCNLMCKMCGAHSSSSWSRESFKHPELENTFHAEGKNKSKSWIEEDGLKIEEFYPLLLDAKTVKFTGGEPFLIPEVKKCVEFLAESEASYNIFLHFITNGTQDISNWIPMFKKFKRVLISVSVDATDELYEYIRQGASWKQVSDNIIKMQDMMESNMQLNVICLPMSLNYYAKQSLRDWCTDNNINYGESSDCMSPVIMSPKALYNKSWKKSLIKHLEMLDRIYNTDYKKVCPHLVDDNE